MKISPLCILILSLNLMPLQGIRAQSDADSTSLPADPATSVVQTKIETISFPKVQFRNATVQEVADFLNRQSVLLDTAEPDPSRRGVKITVDKSAAGKKVTLSLKTMPMSEVLRFLTMLGGVKYTVGPDGVLISG